MSPIIFGNGPTTGTERVWEQECDVGSVLDEPLGGRCGNMLMRGTYPFPVKAKQASQ